MAKPTRAQREWRPGTPKKARSVKTTFASTVLVLEAFVMFFAALVIFGLRKSDPMAPVLLWVGIGLSVLMILACAVLRKPWGYGLGWAIQLLLIAAGFLEPMMFLIGVLFAIAWWYGLRAGGRLDVEQKQRDAEQARWEAEHPDEA
ncbi:MULTISPECIES: DUF4233 domain-containing protein [Arthrobacter]|uniref:DUF4233 domain-containing protein n=2 Tax=Arthrobacter TaxID=1663 RepID=A0ABU9KFL5_9MICC|nr:DUF4233 domain-containing protein [Arthrobacter sp. YJM1]MDP5225666.1 DUF4233 domain-containing protein [Arthrobacter sp. YJM1]